MITKSESVQQPNQAARVPAPPNSRQRSAAHPRYTLQQVERLAQAAFEMGPRHCDQDKLASAVGYKNAQNGAFIGLRATAGQFGLVTVVESKYMSVTEEWIEVLNSEDPARLRLARQEAIRRPDLYRQLLEEYGERQLPGEEKLAR